jgi:YggT family protein
MSQLIASTIGSAVSIYTVLILAAVIFSWIRAPAGALAAIRDAVQSLTEPYLRIFRRLVPPLGRIDFSPIVALLTLQVAGGAAVAAAASL